MFYIFNQATKEFEGSTEGQPNPKEPGKFFKPPFSTEITPMEAPLNKIQVLEDNQWILVDDYRGQFYWIKATAKSVNFELGDAIDNTMTDIDPGDHQIWDEGSNSWIPDPEYVREQKHSELRQNALDASLDPVLAAGFMWNGGEESRDRMNAKASHMESQGIAESQSWDIDNVMHAVSVTDVRAIANAITENVELVGHHYREKKNEYLACGDDILCINSVEW